MAAFNPFYSEETGHIPLDELAPWQQALMNPGARNPGMTMPGYDQNLMSMLGAQPATANPGAGTGGGMMSPDPYTWTGPQNSGAGNAAFNNVFNSGTTPRNTAPAIASPALLANNMSMQGAENVGGVGMYTGSNGPLDLSRFTPTQGPQQNGPPPGSIPTGDPNTWITPWGSTYTTPGSINNQTSADYDAYRQRAFGNMMGPQGAGPQSNPYSELTDALVRQPGSINAQTFQGYLSSLQGQQTGPNPPQQTAPLPRQAGGVMPTDALMRADPYRPYASNVPGQPGYNPNFGQQGGYPGAAGAPVIGSPGMMGNQQGSRQLTQQEQAWYQQYGTLAGLPGQAQFVNPQQIQNPSGGYYPQAPNSVNSNYQQMAAQFSSDPASQAAFIRDFTGYPINYPAGGQQSSNPQNVDFRAATFGGSLFPAPAGGSGSGSSNIPNTTNPSTSQYSTPQVGFGGATNRRGGFGGMSLFGNQFGSGGSTGFGGTQPSQYRGAGSYGRPASYGQSQRPY